MKNNIITKILKNPYLLFVHLGNAGLLNWMNDKLYLRLRFRAKLNKKPNFDSPKTFNEKLQWLKLYDRRSKYVKMVDKYEAKQYTATIVGEDYIIPTLGVWKSFKEINFDMLPDQFVLKTTHDQGGVVICRDKSVFDKAEAKKKLAQHLRRNYFWPSREWPYKNVLPRIIAEKLIGDGFPSLCDYKFMCFNGKVRCTFVFAGRYSTAGIYGTIYNEKWEKLPFSRYNQSSNDNIPKPYNYERMRILSERIAQDIPFLRVDWYEYNNHPFLGELTFYPAGGFKKFMPDEWDMILGGWLELPTKTGT